ncbi:acetyltransferase [Gramella sp. AN32]|uniref:Acetyltransferase n=1 Tax=Christiangramia antarctica TaxID=2058158 RepID=A0ABW5X0S8_9FLAO|nr:acetyltransferase [Gramella sp. AN32]MCM4157099.1 acetyltransferase [Gramella sp. AN32]
MIVYGASGHGKVIIDILKVLDLKIDQILDDNPEIKCLQNYTVAQNLDESLKHSEVVIAIGNNMIRKNIAAKNLKFCAALIHPRAMVSDSANLGKGTVVMANSVINACTKVGNHCIINTGSIIEHDVHIADFAHISPGAIITGNVEIGAGTHIGAGASIIPGIKIGKWAIIGAGAVIIDEVPDYAVVVGNPGKIIKFNKIKNE